MKILFVEHKVDGVEISVAAGKFTFAVKDVPLGLNNNTKHLWELREHCIDTPLPFLKMLCDMELIFVPKHEQ